MLVKNILETLLKNSFKIDDKNLKKYKKEAKEKKVSLEEYLTAENIIKEDELYQAAAQLFSTPFIPFGITKSICFLSLNISETICLIS